MAAGYVSILTVRDPSEKTVRVETPQPMGAPGSKLPAHLLVQIKQRGVIRSFPRKTILIHEGDDSDSIFIIVSGKVRVFVSGRRGKEVVLDFHGAGEYVGEMSLNGEPRSATVITTEPTTCIMVSRTALREFIVEHPDFALHMIGKLIERARLATLNVKRLALTDVYTRLARLLDELAVEEDGRRMIPQRLTHLEIAERIGSSRDMVGRLMRTLLRAGYLTEVDRRIVLVRRLPPQW